MTVKCLRDYLNGLELSEIQSGYIQVVSVGEDGCLVCDDLADIILCSPSDSNFKPYLSMYTEDSLKVIENSSH